MNILISFIVKVVNSENALIDSMVQDDYSAFR